MNTVSTLPERPKLWPTSRSICAATLLSVTIILPLLYGADGPARAEKPATVAEQLASLHLLQGPWTGETIYRESLFFVKPDEGKPTARLLFDADKVLVVHRADGKLAFAAGQDYELSADGASLVLLEGSRVPFRKEAELYIPKGSPHSIGPRTGKPETSLLFGEGHFFHDQQVEVSYVKKPTAQWAGYKPTFAAKSLAGTIAKLRDRQPVTIAVSGDSISQGYNASGFTKAAPFMPPYPELVRAQLEKTYGSAVSLHNKAIAGWSVGQGVKDLDNLLKTKPDLVILAYGMNDVGGRNPDGYKAAMKKLIDHIKTTNAATEIVLVASMLGNPEWAATPAEMFPKYRDALASLTDPGVVLADMTAVWQELLKRKRFVDMTGNGVNHPNDYGHRLYAQVILGLLTDPARTKVTPDPEK